MKGLWAMVLNGALLLLSAEGARHSPSFASSKALAVLGALVLQSGGFFIVEAARSPPSPYATNPPPLPSPPPLTTENCTHIDNVQEGPYWIDENIEASNVRSNVSYGVPLNVTFKIVNETLSALQGACVPIEQARVDIWQSRYDGLYSDVESYSTTGETWLRGYQYTNSTGHASFYTIFPGWYTWRSAHIHVRVRIYEADGNTILYNGTTQLFFDDAVAIAIFNNVYPYNIRGAEYVLDDSDPLFRSANVMNLTGSYNETDGYSSIVEISLPFTDTSLSIGNHKSNGFVGIS